MVYDKDHPGNPWYVLGLFWNYHICFLYTSLHCYRVFIGPVYPMPIANLIVANPSSYSQASIQLTTTWGMCYVFFPFTSLLYFPLISHTVYSAITHIRLILLTNIASYLTHLFTFLCSKLCIYQVYKPVDYLVDSLARTWFIITLKPV